MMETIRQPVVVVVVVARSGWARMRLVGPLQGLLNDHNWEAFILVKMFYDHRRSTNRQAIS